MPSRKNRQIVNNRKNAKVVRFVRFFSNILKTQRKDGETWNIIHSMIRSNGNANDAKSLNAIIMSVTIAAHADGIHVP